MRNTYAVQFIFKSVTLVLHVFSSEICINDGYRYELKKKYDLLLIRVLSLFLYLEQI